jgi:hypothetical protein
VLGSCTGAEAWTKDGLLLRGLASKCLNVANASTTNGSPLVLWPCAGSEPNEKWAYPDSTIEVRVHVVAMADNDGARPATLTKTEFKAWVDRTNGFLARAGIRLVFSNSTPTPDWTTWNNTSVNDLSQGNQNGSAIALANEFATGFRGKAVFFLNQVSQGGFATFPGGGRFVVYDGVGFSSAEWPFLPHEFGHFAGLPHTHNDGLLGSGSTSTRTAMIQTLNQNGGNIAPFNGDNLSDTPPDPTPGGWATGQDPCTTDLNVTLSSGQVVQFRPDKFNFMGYWGCADRRSMTPDQIQVMRSNLLTHPDRADIGNDSMPTFTNGVATFKTMDGRPQIMSGGNGRAAAKWKLTSDSNSGLTEWVYFGTPAISGPMAGVNFADTTGEVWAVLSDGTLSTRWQGAGGGWVDWTNMLTPVTPRDLATSRTPDNRARLYVVGTNGQIKMTEKTAVASGSAWSSWTDLSHSVSARRLSVGILQDGREHLFMVGTDGALYGRFQTTVGGSWSGWSTMTAPNPLADVEAGYATDGRIQLYAISGSTTGNIITSQKVTTDPNSAWTAWSNVNTAIGGFASVSSFRLPDGRPQIVGVSSGVMWSTFWTGSGWNAWLGL